MNATTPAPAGATPVVIAGMHRSGTSLVASLLSKLGVEVGLDLLPEDRHNPRGYYEDLAFLDLNRRLLAAATTANDGGHPDWGWTESERIDTGCFESFRSDARRLVDERMARQRRWGWKDPRTTVLLDFWHALLVDPLYLFVYRFPWEVADSMQRLGAAVFLNRPDYAYSIWSFYNRHLLDFHRRHAERCLLVSADALRRQPDWLASTLGGRWHVDFDSAAPLATTVDEGLFEHLEPADPLVSLAMDAHPDCRRLLEELDQQADLPGASLWQSARSQRRGAARHASPRISVVIPCLDQGEFLIESAASFERCVDQPSELIVVNDGSGEPRTLEIFELLRQRGHLVLDQPNRGLAAARNRGFELARADYVLPLDADNRLRPGFVDEALTILESEPTVAVVYGDRQNFGLRDELVDVPPFDLDALLPFNFIDACALVRRQAWKDVGGYDGDMPHPGWEDWLFWLQIAAAGWDFRHLPVPAFDYRVRPGSMLSGFDNENPRRSVLRYVIEKQRDLYWRRLPEAFLSAQNAAAELSRLARLREEAELRSAAAIGAESEARQRAESHARALEERLRDLAASCERLRTERERQSEELRAWATRVESMEKTRAWRLRSRLLRLKNALKRLTGGERV
jgi:glycosyltransferase involved in cell wall biosynthesis